jgi:predicted transcriptional regulator
MSSNEGNHSWHFLSNHTQVLLCISRNPDIRFRDIAQTVGITERATQRIVADLIQTGFLEREKIGRRNHYKLHPDRKMRHASQANHEIGDLLHLFQPTAAEQSKARSGT